VTAVGDVAGTWRASDELDFTYTLTIGADGAYEQWIDRNRIGRCRQKGTLAGTGKALQLTYQIDDCKRDDIGTTQPLAIESFTGDALTIAIAGERRAYRRAAR